MRPLLRRARGQDDRRVLPLKPTQRAIAIGTPNTRNTVPTHSDECPEEARGVRGPLLPMVAGEKPGSDDEEHHPPFFRSALAAPFPPAAFVLSFSASFLRTSCAAPPGLKMRSHSSGSPDAKNARAVALT